MIRLVQCCTTSLTHSLTHSHTHLLHSLTHPLTRSLHTHFLTLTLTHSLSYSLTLTLTHSLSHSLTQCLYSIGHILHITASQHPLEKGLQWDGLTIQQLRDQEMAREQEKEQVVDKEGEDKGNRRQSILQAVRSSMSNVTMQDEDTGEDVCDTTLAVLSIAFISVLGHAETQSARTSFRSTWSVGLHWTTHQTTGTVAVCAVYM